MVDFLRIPQRRVGILVGKKGRNKTKLQRELDCTIEVSKEGDVKIECKNPLDMLKANSIIKAIGRGFSVRDSLFLMDDSYSLDIINLKEIFGVNEKKIQRMKARIIGSDGKIKKKIEDITDTNIVVSGKTVSVIGTQNNVMLAREAIGMILDGKMHSSVISFLERKKSM